MTLIEMPSRGFTKLDCGIVDSTLWMKEHDALRVWIALLAKSDAYGLIRASAPAMAHICFVTLERFEEIIKDFTSPDPHSRTPENEGRRLAVIEGGWCILNYLKYRDMMQRKSASHAERQAKYREKLKQRDALVTPTVTRDTEAEAEAEAEKKEAFVETNVSTTEQPIQNPKIEPVDEAVDCPHGDIIRVYHEELPMLRQVRTWTPQRQQYLRSRWREDKKRQDLEFWRGLFGYVRDRCPFLIGQKKADFQVDLEWIVRPSNFVKIIEGKYEEKAGASRGDVPTISAADLAS